MIFRRLIAYAALAVTLAMCGIPSTAHCAVKAQSIQFLLSQVRNTSGPLSGGKVYFYAAGTSTLKTVWLDRSKTTAAANPYTLDSNGTAQLYGDGVYKIIIKTSAGVTVYNRDNQSFRDISGLVYDVADYASLAAAVASIGSTKATLQYATDQTLTANLSIPATLELMPQNGAKIIHAAYTISYAGSTERWDDSQKFDGTGAVTLSGSAVTKAKWFYPATGSPALAIQKAVAATATGGTLLISQVYTVKDDLPIILTKSINIDGGLKGGQLLIDPTVTTDIFFVALASPTTTSNSIRFKDLVVKPVSGTPGRDIIRANVWKSGSSEYVLREFIVEGCEFETRGGYGVNVQNGYDAAGTVADISPNGLFHSRIENNSIYATSGGIKANKIGDSNKIVSNIITGGGIGIDITQLITTDTYGASSSLLIDHNNITSTGGAVKLRDARNYRIALNNIECSLADSSKGVVDVASEDVLFTVSNSKIEHNKVSASGNATIAILVDKDLGAFVGNNQITMTGTTNTGIKLVATNKARLVDNQINAGTGVYTAYATTTATKNAFIRKGKINKQGAGTMTDVDDLGIGTKGIWKDLDLSGGLYISYSASTPTPRYMKDEEGIVHLKGDLKQSSTPFTISGAFVTAMPDGFKSEMNSYLMSHYRIPATNEWGNILLRAIGSASGGALTFVNGNTSILDSVDLVSIDGLSYYSADY